MSRLPPRSKLLSAVRRFAAPKILRQPGPAMIPAVREARFQSYPPNTHHMDFARGISEQAAALRENRPCRLSARFILHVNEIVLALQPPLGTGGTRPIISTFEPMAPMPWA
ncbi:MAG: hypothetical protein WA434_13370 [Candidatus Acidiferrales bacterium]